MGDVKQRVKKIERTKRGRKRQKLWLQDLDGLVYGGPGEKTMTLEEWRAQATESDILLTLVYDDEEPTGNGED
ncbi:MAG: hypothetical protein FJZ90_02325 [Chloroflexi bacterium]|nr:hypothetical protein [Chloroflexota bacterium]